MRGKVCAVFGCSNYEVEKNARSFFRFPRDKNMYKCDLWVLKCHRSHLDKVYKKEGTLRLYKNYKICSDHLQASDFKNPRLYSQGFPFSRPEILKKWCHAISRQKWTPSTSSRICSKHFTDDCYQVRPGAPIRLLKESAVPSIFYIPNHLQEKKEVTRQVIQTILTTSLIKTEAETSCSDIPKVSESEKMAVTSKNKAVVPRRRSARIPAREKNKCTNLPRRRRQSTTQAQKTRTKLTEICSKDACVAAVKKRGQPPEGSSPKESSLKRKADARIPCKKSARISEKLSRKPIKKEDDVRKLKSLEEGTRQQDGDEDKGSGGLVKGDCVICNNYTDNGTVLDSQTLTSKMHFYQKLIKVTAEENEVMVSEEGVLCSICTRLLNYMDRIEMELAMLKTAIINCLRKKCSTKQKACRTDQDHHDHPGEGNKMVIRHNSTEVKDDVENVSDHRQQTSDVQNPNEPKPVREAHHIILENTNTPSYQDKSIENECEVPSKQYNCTICSFTTMYKSMIIFHLRQHVKDSFRCDFCNITISENFERPLKMSTLRHLRYKRAALPLPTRVMSTVPLDSAPIPASSGAAILRKKHSKC